MKFKEQRPYAEPEIAARKLLDLVRASIAESGLPYAHTGSVNSAFLKDVCLGRKWFEIDRSGTRAKEGADRRHEPGPGLELRLIEAARFIAKRKPRELMLLMATKRPSYYIVTSETGTQPHAWKWELHSYG